MAKPAPTVSEAYAMATMNAVYAMEKKLDAELEAMDELGQDDLEAIRKKRMQQLKAKKAKAQVQKQISVSACSLREYECVK